MCDHRTGLAAILLMLATGSSPISAQDASRETAIDPIEQLIFVPHDVGAPEVTEVGGVRGEHENFILRVLAPPRLARTANRSPTLFWFIDQATAATVQITLMDETSIAPLVETRLEDGAAAGVHAFSLAERGVALEPLTVYEWSVAIETAPDSPSREPLARTFLFYEPQGDGPALDVPPLERARAFAGDGYWYDALATITQGEGSATNDLAALRVNLLKQAGLTEAAVFERARFGQNRSTRTSK